VGIAGCGGSPSGNGGSNGGGGGSSSTAVTVTFQGTTPTAVAAKIGSGSFTAQTLNSGVVTLSLPSGTTNFTVAFVCPPVAVTSGGTQIGQTGRESVIEASTLDATSLTESCAVSPQSFQTGMLTGSVDASAIPAASFLSVNAQSGTSGASFSSGTPVTNFTLNAPAGSDRVEVLAFNGASQGAVETFSLVAAKNFSSQAAPGALNGGNTVVLGSADETTEAPITYNSVPSGFPPLSTIVIYQTAGDGAFLIANAATNQYPVLPSGAIQNGDSYAFEATARDNFQAVSSFISASAGGPVSFTFPAPWSYAGPTPATLPTLDFNYTGFAGESGVTEAASLGWSVGTYSENFITLIASTNYQKWSNDARHPRSLWHSGIFGKSAVRSSGRLVSRDFAEQWGSASGRVGLGNVEHRAKRRDVYRALMCPSGSALQLRQSGPL
jgi:hypothetical protein